MFSKKTFILLSLFSLQSINVLCSQPAEGQKKEPALIAYLGVPREEHGKTFLEACNADNAAYKKQHEKKVKKEVQLKKENPNPLQKKRTLLSELPQQFNGIPDAVWKRYIAPCADFACKINPFSRNTLPLKSYPKRASKFLDARKFLEKKGKLNLIYEGITAISPNYLFLARHSGERHMPVEIVDIATGRTFAVINIPEKNYSFSREMLIDGSEVSRLTFTEDSNSIIIGLNSNDCYVCGDISFLNDKKLSATLRNQLTQQQSTFLMLLDEIQKKNNNQPISLLHDIALKRALPLKELHDTLASFHPMIQKSLIKRYKILDPTPDKIKTKIVEANTWGWQNMLKLSLAGAAIGVLGYLWWNKDTQSKSK